MIFLNSLFISAKSQTLFIDQRVQDATQTYASHVSHILINARKLTDVVYSLSTENEEEQTRMMAIKALLKANPDVRSVAIVDNMQAKVLYLKNGQVEIWRGSVQRVLPGLNKWLKDWMASGDGDSLNPQANMARTLKAKGIAYARRLPGEERAVVAFVPQSRLSRGHFNSLKGLFYLTANKGEPHFVPLNPLALPDQNNTFINHAGLKDAWRQLATGDQYVLEMATQGQQLWALARQPIVDQHWSLLGVVSMDNLVVPERTLLWWEVFIMVTSLGLVAWVIWIVSGFIARPVRILDKAMERVSKGNFDTRIDIRSKDEFGRLAQRFSFMTEQLVLRENAERKARLTSFDRIADAMTGHYFYFSHDCDGQVNYVSPSVQNVLGMDMESFSRHFSHYYTQAPANSLGKEITRQLMKGRQSGIYEVEMYGGDGRIHLIEVVKVPVYDHAGKVVGIEGMARDVTKRVSDTARFRGLLESAPDAMVITNEQGVITMVNARTEALFGYMRTSLIGEVVTCLFPDREKDHFPLSVIREGKWSQMRIRSGFEMKALERSGKTLPIELTLSPIDTPEGRLISLSMRDISDRHAAEAALRSSEERYRRMIEGLQQEYIFYTRRLDGSYIYITDSVERILGYSPEDYMANHVRYYHRDEDREWAQEVREQVAMGKSQPPYELEIVRADGSVCVVEVLDTPAFNDRGQVTAIEGLVRDRTAERAAGRALSEARDVAEAANQAKSLFLSNMSHELRTPLNGVLGYAQLLLGDSNVNKEQQERLISIQACGQHLLTLINDILDLTKIEAGEIELHTKAVNMPVLLDSVEQILYQRAESKGLSLGISIKQNVPHCIYTDETKMRQILINLVGNAIKFTNKGHVELTVSMMDGQVICDVADTGIGIAEQHLTQIFDPFRQGDGSYQEGGTGLGLPISRRLVDAMGGRMWVKSTKGKGSCFSFSIPLEHATDDCQCLPVMKKDIGNDGTLSPDQNVRVLVVDDTTTNRDILVQILERAGFIVEEASGGREAVRLAKQHDFDLVLMDLRMPEMSGFRATRYMKILLGVTCPPVIAISAGIYTALLDDIKRWGFAEFISKPFRTQELFRVIRRNLNVEWQHSESARDPGELAGDRSLPELPAVQARQIWNSMKDSVDLGDVEAVREVALAMNREDAALAEWAVRIEEYCDDLALDRLENMMTVLVGN